MILKLIREPMGPERTFGVLFTDGYFQCFTMENTMKIIPSGIYSFIFYDSPKNKCVVPLLQSVPGRSTIEIHPANFESELEGCIAVGTSKNDTMLLNSKEAFNNLMLKIRNEKYNSIWIQDK